MFSGVLLAAAAATSFNLVCNGIGKTGIIAGSEVTNVRTQLFTITYRIDLKRFRWCSNACESTKPLVSVDDTTIVFQSDHLPTKEFRQERTVNRENGAYRAYNRLGTDSSLFEGTCDVAPFGGFPEPKF